jgi:predicted O-methyltransferase YrrM
MMNIWQRTIRADEWRRTRLHDMKGNRASVRTILIDLPRAAAGAVARELFDWRPTLPWVPYNVIHALSTYIRPDWRVLEYGSGMSTLWLAERVAYVHSIELNTAWHAHVAELLAVHRRENVRLELRDESNYTNLIDYDDGAFDLVMVDASFRDAVIAATLRLVRRPGGVTYLDNTDQGAQWEMYAEAERLLREEAARACAQNVKAFTGFAPTQVIANEGLLVVW